MPYERIGEQPAGQRAHRRRGHRHRRRARADQGRAARRRRRDRPADLRRSAGRSNPDHPYDDPRVDVHINDGRAFLERTDTKYDLIIFALPDSLTLVAGDEPAATRELPVHPGGARGRARPPRARRRVRDVQLLPRGLARRPARATPRQPRSVTTRASTCSSTVRAVIIGGLTPRRPDLRTGAGAVTRRARGPGPVTDGRPFLYLKDAGIPSIYLSRIGMILRRSASPRCAWSAARCRRCGRTPTCSSSAPRSCCSRPSAVTGFALLFGTTWVVNAIVFTGVLLAVLAAVEVTRRFRTPSLPVMYALLAAAWLLAWLVPERLAAVAAADPLRSWSPRRSPSCRSSAPTSCSPSGSRTRPRTPRRFGANLLGAMVGGCLEYTALVVGYPALLGRRRPALPRCVRPAASWGSRHCRRRLTRDATGRRARGGNRTHDLTLTRRLLCRLSYSGGAPILPGQEGRARALRPGDA